MYQFILWHMSNIPGRNVFSLWGQTNDAWWFNHNWHCRYEYPHLTGAHWCAADWLIHSLFCLRITTKYTNVCVYLSCEVEGWRLGNRTVHLPKHLAQLRHHGSKVVEQSLHRLLKDGAHRLRDDMRSYVLTLSTHLIMRADFLESRGLTARYLPRQPASRWATYWAQSVWEQTLAAKPPPPEEHKNK